MEYSTVKVKRNSNETFHYFRPIWTGNVADKCVPFIVRFIQAHLINLTSSRYTILSEITQNLPPNHNTGFGKAYK